MLYKIFFIFFILFCSPIIYAKHAPLPAQVLLNVYQEPSPIKADDKYFLVYEIYLTNYMKDISKLNFFQINDTHKRDLITYKNIKDSIQSRDNNNHENSLTFTAGETKTLFIWIPYTNESELPKELIHHLTIASSFAGKKYVFSMGNYHVRVAPYYPFMINPPLRGKNWLAGNGLSNTSDHRRTSIIINGKPYYAQRYAIDFVQMGSDGRSYTGDIHKNSSYHCYSQDLLAVADGKVIKIQDGIPENIPNSSKFAIPINEKTLPGNYIIIDLGKGKYAGYAHIIPGSFKVKEGDLVKQHQILAKLGNSGNSSEPHLHFQITDAGSFLMSNGVPYGFHHFSVHPSELVDDSDISLHIKISNKKFEERTNQLVLQNSLINFE